MSDTLPEPPADPNTQLTDVVEAVEEQGDADQQEAARALASTSQEVNEAIGSMELQTFADANRDNAQDANLQSPDIAVADEDNPELRDLKSKMGELTDKLRPTDISAKQYNLARFLAGFSVFSALASGSTLIYNAIKASRDHTDPAIPQELQANVAAIVSQWWSLSDTDYWQSLAAYMGVPQTPDLTLADQIVFMNYTIDLSPDFEPWLWSSSDEFVSQINALIGIYAKNQNSTAAMYTFVSTMTYDGPSVPQPGPVPRAVAADLLRYALTRILVQAS